MPTVLSGLPAGSAVVGPNIDDSTILTNRRVIDMNPVIQQLEPDSAPLTTMLMKLPSKPANSQKVEWIEDELLPRLTTAIAYTNVATTVGVAAGTGQYFRARDIIQNMVTGESMVVASVAGDVLTVTNGRGLGGVVVAVAGSTGDGILRVGNASYEGQYLGDIKMVKQVAQFNYCQIQRNPFGVTETLAASRLWGGSEPEYEAKRKLIEHKRDMENTIFFGRRALDTTTLTGAVSGMCGGLLDFIPASTTVGGALTTANMEAFLQLGFRYGSRKKVFFCSPLIGGELAGLALGKLAPPSPAINTWGVSLSTYQSSQGDMISVVVKRDWADFLNQTTGAINTSMPYGGYGFLVDMEYIRLRPLRSTVLKPNRQRNDEDANKQEYLTEYSLEINLVSTSGCPHRIMKGVT